MSCPRQVGVGRTCQKAARGVASSLDNSVLLVHGLRRVKAALPAPQVRGRTLIQTSPAIFPPARSEWRRQHPAVGKVMRTAIHPYLWAQSRSAREGGKIAGDVWINVLPRT